MLNVLIYIAVIIFAVVLGAKVIRYATMPVQLRWEIYPVPHEKRAEHGGSYYEEQEWWKKPREKTILGEIKDTLKEMLFIVKVFKNKRTLWYLTYPFHLGIYLILIWFLLLFISAVLDLLMLKSEVLDYLTLLVGAIAMILMFIFGIALLIKRAADYDLRSLSAPVDYFNLIFILAVVFTGLLAWMNDPNFSLAKDYMKSLITFKDPPKVSDITAVHIVLLSLLLIYIPFSKMTHFVGKYFTYHRIFWDDELNVKGSKINEKVKRYLNYKIKWGASHVDPNLTWAENAVRSDLAEKCEVKL